MFIDHNANLPAGYLHRAQQLEVTLNGEQLFVTRYSQFDEPCYVVHVSLEEGKEYDLWVAIKRKHNTFFTHSFSENLAFETKRYGNGKGQYTATVRENSYHVLSSDGIGYICLCFDPAKRPDGR